jgi:hypothetical protein
MFPQQRAGCPLSPQVRAGLALDACATWLAELAPPMQPLTRFYPFPLSGKNSSRTILPFFAV